MIRVQSEAFDAGSELNALLAGAPSAGAATCFVGTVRDLSHGRAVETMTLEHYPGMTESALEEIEAEAHRRWPLEQTLIVHRHGPLKPADAIVLVIATSAHREAAFEACAFLIDWLKTKAPFWKLEAGPDGDADWVEARDADDEMAARWRNTES